jgi:CheY-like chemotaxis protein
MIEIHLDLDPELPFISGDPGQIEQVLLNLATNAAQAMPDGGLLTFTTRSPELSPEQAKAWPGLPPGPQVSLEVSDTGLGMDEETISHIFEPFFTTKPLGEGTGLGLSTVYGIVANHGGRITCRSALREGSTFTIHLPSRHTHAAAPAPAPFAPAPLLAGSETILVVDDEEAIRDSCREALADQGYGVLLAASGEEALNLCRQRPGRVHLVILDLNMPGMGGFRCLEALLRLAPPPKVVISSGYRSEAIARDLSDLGADGFVDKPYRLKEMMAKVREVLDRREPPPQDAGF